MNSIDTLLNQHFGSQAPECTDAIVAAAVGYLLRVRSSVQLTAAIRESIPDAHVVDFRKDLQTAYFLRNLKLWIWRVVTRGYSPRLARTMMDTYDVLDDDIEIARVVHHNPQLLADVQLQGQHYRGHRLAQYDEIMESILHELHSHISRFAWRRLRFISKNGYMSMDDIITDLKMYGLYSMRLQYPKVQSRLHLVNVCKNSVRNFGMNMIASFTTKSRQHMRQEDDGSFSAVKVSIDSVNHDNFLTYHNHTSDITGASSEDGNGAAGVLDRISVTRVMEGLAGPRREFLELLLGHHNEGFSEWLQSIGYMENDELLDVLLEEDDVNSYISLAAEFVGISEYRANTILNEMRQNL